jgi:hypothetical protein
MANAHQLEPLSDRLTKHQQTKRAFKIEARRTIADVLAREAGITRGIVVATATRVQKQQAQLRIEFVLTVIALVLGLIANYRADRVIGCAQ